MGQVHFFFNSNFVAVNLPTHICPAKSSQLFLMLTHGSSSKRKDIIKALNVYKIPAKEHLAVNC